MELRLTVYVEKLIVVFVAVDAILSMHFMYAYLSYSYWGWLAGLFMDIMTTLVLVFYMMIKHNYMRIQIKKLFAVLFIILFFLYTGFNYVDKLGITVRTTMNIFKLCIIFMLKEDEIKEIFECFRNILAFILLYCICIYTLKILGISLPYTIISPSENNEIYHYYYNYFGCLLLHEDLTYWRLCGFFNEPGVIGTVCALFLCADDFRIKNNWQNVVFMIASIMSFSTAFAVILILYFFLDKVVFKHNIKNLVFVISIALIIIWLDTFLCSYSLEYANFFHDKVINFMTHGSSNRTSEYFELLYSNMWDSNDWILGYGGGSRIGIKTLSYKGIIYDYGIVGIGLLFLLLLSVFAGLKQRNKNSIIFLIVYVCSLYQRPYTLNLFALLIYYGGLIYAVHIEKRSLNYENNVHQQFTQYGGAEHLITEYMIKMRQRGHEVILLELYKDDTILVRRLKQHHIKIIPLYRFNVSNTMLKKIIRRIVPYMAKPNVNKIIKEENPDIIHINGSIDWLHGIDFPVERMFYTFHTEIERDFNMRGNLHHNTLLKNAKKGMNILVLSQQMLMDAKKIIGSEKIYYLPNGINIEEIQKKSISAAYLRKQMGIPQDAFVLGHIGRIHPVKNHQKIVSIFSEVKKIKNNAYLVLIGEGESQYVDEIRKQVYQIGVEKNVMFTGLREDAVILMNMFDAFVLPSFQEGFPLVVMEAQALHIRTVLSNAVPDEAICNANCFKLDIKESSKVWAEYVTGDFLSENTKDIWEYDINVILKKLITCYQMAMDA